MPLGAGIGNVAGNKGGVGVALTYMKHTRMLFVNAHFQAHTHRVAGRQADYLRIKAGLFNNRDESGAREPICQTLALTPDCLPNTLVSALCPLKRDCSEADMLRQQSVF